MPLFSTLVGVCRAPWAPETVYPARVPFPWDPPFLFIGKLTSLSSLPPPPSLLKGVSRDVFTTWTLRYIERREGTRRPRAPVRVNELREIEVYSDYGASRTVSSILPKRGWGEAEGGLNAFVEVAMVRITRHPFCKLSMLSLSLSFSTPSLAALLLLLLLLLLFCIGSFLLLLLNLLFRFHFSFTSQFCTRWSSFSVYTCFFFVLERSSSTLRSSPSFILIPRFHLS